MRPSDNLEQLLREEFAATAVATPTPGQLAAVLERTRRTRQRPGWLSVGAAPARSLVPAGLAPLALLVLLALALFAVALAALAIRPSPPPRIDGAIAVERWAVAPDVWSQQAGAPPRVVTLVAPDRTLSAITPPDREEACASFSPDGSRVALLSAPRRTSDRSDPIYELAVGDTRPGAERTVLAPGLRVPLQQISQASWAPDGSAVAAVLRGPDQPSPREGDLLVVPADGSTPRIVLPAPKLPADTRQPQPGLFRFQGPSWSPDGSWIAFRGEIFNGQGWGYFIAVVHPDGTDLRLLDTWPRSGSGEWGGVTWSPDSEWVAYHRRPPGVSGGAMHPYVASVDDASGRRLTMTGTHGFVADWSPDGSRIATVDISRGRSQIVDFATGEATILSLPAGADSATWSADGKRLAVLQEGRLWLVETDGSKDPEVFVEDVDSLCAGIGPGISWQELEQ